MSKTAAIIPAAGSGVRMGGGKSKQFLDLDQRPILAVTLTHFQKCDSVDGVFLVVPEQDIEYCEKKIIGEYHLDKVIRIVAGGSRRQDSVRLGLEAAEGYGYDSALIHDGVRPMITTDLINRIISAARIHRAVITAIPAKDTVKEINEKSEVVSTYNRSNVRLIQTPQIFRFNDILNAHRKALKEGWEEATDDSALIEKLGITVHVLEGLERNIKITTPDDLMMVKFFSGFNKKGY